ncbi:VOC family protein [Chloroflexota bacterium]
MSIKLIHVGIIVEDLEEAKSMFEKLLHTKAGEVQGPPDGSMRAVMINCADGSGLELIQPVDPQVRKERGLGLNHVCLQVDDADEALEAAAKNGFKLRDQKSHPSRMFSDHQIGFLDPTSTKGITVEYLQPI